MGSLYLLLFAPGRVYIHEGQTHVRLWHDDRISTVKTDAFHAELLLQTVDGARHGVAGCAHRVAEMGATVYLYVHPLIYKLKHQLGRTPSVNGKDEAQSLAGL